MSNNFAKNNEQNPRVTVNDGTKKYDIYNQRGEKLGHFIFSPSDMGIVDRYDHAVIELEDIQKMMEQDDSKEAASTASERIKKEMDYLFNADVSGSFFSISSPFTILETGEFYIVTVLDAVKGIIETETGTRLKRAKTRASKYTQKYHR